MRRCGSHDTAISHPLPQHACSSRPKPQSVGDHRVPEAVICAGRAALSVQALAFRPRAPCNTSPRSLTTLPHQSRTLFSILHASPPACKCSGRCSVESAQSQFRIILEARGYRSSPAPDACRLCASCGVSGLPHLSASDMPFHKLRREVLSSV